MRREQISLYQLQCGLLWDSKYQFLSSLKFLFHLGFIVVVFFFSIIGLGDRHSENILIDTSSGECVHVDFDW